MMAFISSELPRDGLCPTCRKPVDGWQITVVPRDVPLRKQIREVVVPPPRHWTPCAHPSDTP